MEINPPYTGGRYRNDVGELPPSQSLLMTESETNPRIWREVLDAIVKVVVLVTCLALLVTMAEVWHIAIETQRVLDAFRESFAHNGLIGN